MTVVLLSFAGIPLTAGFFSKFFAVFAVFQDARATANASLPAIVAALGVLGSVLAAYFYFNMIRTIWFRGEPPAIPAAAGADDRRWNYAFVAWLGVALLIGLGIYPFPLML
jgi:NADH-quinone oxidoreductase subunit N